MASWYTVRSSHQIIRSRVIGCVGRRFNWSTCHIPLSFRWHATLQGGFDFRRKPLRTPRTSPQVAQGSIPTSFLGPWARWQKVSKRETKRLRKWNPDTSRAHTYTNAYHREVFSSEQGTGKLQHGNWRVRSTTYYGAHYSGFGVCATVQSTKAAAFRFEIWFDFTLI